MNYIIPQQIHEVYFLYNLVFINGKGSLTLSTVIPVAISNVIYGWHSAQKQPAGVAAETYQTFCHWTVC